MNRVMRKPALCICKNKDADQLRGNRTADLHLCFRYKDKLLTKSQIFSLLPSSVVVQPDLCRTWSETLMSSEDRFSRDDWLIYTLVPMGTGNVCNIAHC